MPIQFNAEDNGKILALRINGKVTRADLQSFVPEFERGLREHGKLRVFFDITHFHGWEAGALWEEVKFDVKHFADIERLAVVGDKQWHHAIATVFKPFTKAAIRYFDLAEAADGRKWLGAA